MEEEATGGAVKRKQHTPNATKQETGLRVRIYGNAKAPIGTVGQFRMRDGKSYGIDHRGVIRRIHDEDYGG